MKMNISELIKKSIDNKYNIIIESNEDEINENYYNIIIYNKTSIFYYNVEMIDNIIIDSIEIIIEIDNKIYENNIMTFINDKQLMSMINYFKSYNKEIESVIFKDNIDIDIIIQ